MRALFPLTRGTEKLLLLELCLICEAHSVLARRKVININGHFNQSIKANITFFGLWVDANSVSVKLPLCTAFYVVERKIPVSPEALHGFRFL